MFNPMSKCRWACATIIGGLCFADQASGLCGLWPYCTTGFVTLPIRFSDAPNIISSLFNMADTAERAAIGHCCLAAECTRQNMIDFAFTGFQHGRAFLTFAVCTGNDLRLDLAGEFYALVHFIPHKNWNVFVFCGLSFGEGVNL